MDINEIRINEINALYTETNNNILIFTSKSL